MPNFLAELQRRNVIRVAIAYLAVSWFLLQAGGLVFDAFDLPHSALRMVFVVLALGLIPVLIFSWVYELTPDGLKRDSEVDPSQSIAHLTGRKLDFIVIGVLAAMVVLLLIDHFILTSHHAAEAASSTAATAARGSLPTAANVNADVHDSIAVLPFADMSEDKNQGYFSDGLAEELLDQLAKIPQLRVIGRTSSFSFKGSHDDLKTIGQKLVVGTLLEGSVRKSGDRLRVSAQLINAKDGYELWSQTYDRQMTDVFAVQDDIAGSVIAALKLKLRPGQETASNQHRTSNSDAFEHYLLGRQFLHRSNAEGYRLAIEADRQAIALDPDYAAAYAGLALAEMYAADYADSSTAVAAGQQRGLAAADKAIALDPELAEGYAARGYLRSAITWDWPGAQADFARALELDAGDSITQGRYAVLLADLGRLPEAIAAGRKATTLDPLRSALWSWQGSYLNSDGQFAQAQQVLRRALEIDPNYAYAHFNLGTTALLEGKAQVALSEFKQAGETFSLTGLAMAEHSLGNAAESQRALDELIAKYSQNSAYQIAQAYAWRGENDQAFAWLERAYAQHDAGLSDVKYDALLAKLRNDPRYTALIKKIGLPL